MDRREFNSIRPRARSSHPPDRSSVYSEFSGPRALSQFGSIRLVTVRVEQNRRVARVSKRAFELPPLPPPFALVPTNGTDYLDVRPALQQRQL